MVENRDVRRILSSYVDAFPEDQHRLQRLRTLLANFIPVTHPGARDHVTASAVVLNDEGMVLLVDGAIPGGPLDRDDSTMADAAVRNLSERAGMSADAVEPLLPVPVQIRACAAPVRLKISRVLFDFRFAFLTSATSTQAAQARWVIPDWLPDPVLEDRTRNLTVVCNRDRVAGQGKSHVLPDGAIKWAVAKYQDGRGLSIRALASACDVNYSTMRTALVHAGAKLPSHASRRESQL